MIEALIGGAVDLDEEAEKLTWDREGFGWTLAMLDEGELLVGIQQHNAVVKIESPLIGHPIPYTVSDPTTGDTFAYTDAIPTALTGEIDLGDEPSGDPQCGFTVAAGAFVDEAGSQGIFVGCPGLNQPSVAYRDADWTDHSAFDALGWSVGTGDDGGSGVEQFGYSASVGDVNGDGFDDLLVGEPRADHGLRNSGAAYLYFGPRLGFCLSGRLGQSRRRRRGAGLPGSRRSSGVGPRPRRLRRGPRLIQQRLLD